MHIAHRIDTNGELTGIVLFCPSCHMMREMPKKYDDPNDCKHEWGDVVARTIYETTYSHRTCMKCRFRISV